MSRKCADAVGSRGVSRVASRNAPSVCAQDPSLRLKNGSGQDYAVGADSARTRRCSGNSAEALQLFGSLAMEAAVMTGLYRWTLALMVVLLWSDIASASDGQAGDIATILKQFPGYHVLTLQERDPDARSYIVQHFPKANVSVLHADFDGDGHEDYALLLKNDRSAKAQLVVVLCSADGQCKTAYKMDVSEAYKVTYLSPVPVGSRVSQTEAMRGNGHSPGRLKTVGIRVTYDEQAEVVLYWNSKLRKIEEVQTSD